MKLEPVGHINAEQLGALIAGNEDQATITSDWKLPSDTPLYAIPEGYVVVPVEPTEEWIANMRKGTIEPQGMDAQAKIIEDLRRNYKRWIAAAKERS